MRPQKQVRQCDGLRGTRTATGRKFRDSETTCPHLPKANLLRADFGYVEPLLSSHGRVAARRRHQGVHARLRRALA